MEERRQDHERVTDALHHLTLRLSDLQDSIEREAAETRKALPGAFKAIAHDQEAMDAFWSAAFSSLQASAQRHTGEMIVAGLKTGLRKLFMFAALGLIVYALGGWTGLVKLWHVIWSQS